MNEKKIILLKLGGASLRDPQLIQALCKDTAMLKTKGFSLVFVHGGGASINEELTRRGMKWEFYQGQRVTTPEMMEVIEMVLCGRNNRLLVRMLNAAGIPSVGLSGADAGLLVCERETEPVGNTSKWGEVGRIQAVNTSLLKMFLDAGLTPVIAPVGIDPLGQALNINADWVASQIGQALGVAQVIYLTDQEGIMDHQKTRIDELDSLGLQALIDDAVVTGGMLIKTKAIIHALKNKVQAVHVMKAADNGEWVRKIFAQGGGGTICRSAHVSL
jgi:acetylglutamate kinase